MPPLRTAPAILANDFHRQWADLGPDALAAFARVGSSGWYILGQEVRAFENDLAAQWGLTHAVGVASGLDAIELALRALGCGPGDLVLTTPLSAFATTLAILRVGAVPVFCDTDDSGQLDLDRCAALLEKRPEIRYLVPVHLYGQPLNLDHLRQLRERFPVHIIEDCAQSVAATWNGAPTGSIGQAAATSFYPTKNLGAMGDGGAALTHSAELSEKIAQLRDYGQSAKYVHSALGANSRLDELQAAYLRSAVLPRLQTWTVRRRAIARAYLQGIQQPHVTLLEPAAEARPCWHLFPVFVAPERRGAFLDHLKASGIGAGIHYPIAIPDQPVMRDVPHELADPCTTARRIALSEVSLPIHPYLTDEEISAVIIAVNTWR